MPPWWYTPIKRPKNTLKAIQMPAQMRNWVWFFGSCTEESIRGIVGRRKRASWCWNIDKTKTPDIAEYRRSERWGRRKTRMAAGPRSCGRLKRTCWYHGCKPCVARLLVWRLYARLLRGVIVGWENR